MGNAGLVSFLSSTLCCSVLCACAGGGVAPAPVAAQPAAEKVQFNEPIARMLHKGKSSNPIQHIVIIIQENQSYDHLFQGYGNYATSGKIHTGATVPLVKQELGTFIDTEHSAQSFLIDYDSGKMDGFDLNTARPRPYLGAYTYIDPADIGPYHQMANQYVLSDNYFTSHIDASFVAHQYLIAAQANHAVNLPSNGWGCVTKGSEGDFIQTLNQNRTGGPLESPCFTYTTMGDELDSAGLTWHDYAPALGDPGSIWSAYQAVSHIYNGPDWTKDVISPETQILTDVPNGILSNVTWVTPDTANSDHPGSDSMTGPSWVASVVNAIGNSQFWDSTVIFVTWDEWGGEYDHVPPPYMDYDGDGFRVPLLCISPYAYAGAINSTQLEAGSILKYVEQTFNLPTLASADARATAADVGCTNPSQTTPRPFSAITASYDRNYFLHQKHSHTPPDDY
jgi:phospholipase C